MAVPVRRHAWSAWCSSGLFWVSVSRTPVDLGITALVEDLLDDFGVEELSEVLADEGEPLLGFCGRHGRSGSE